MGVPLPSSEKLGSAKAEHAAKGAPRTREERREENVFIMSAAISLRCTPHCLVIRGTSCERQVTARSPLRLDEWLEVGGLMTGSGVDNEGSALRMRTASADLDPTPQTASVHTHPSADHTTTLPACSSSAREFAPRCYSPPQIQSEYGMFALTVIVSLFHVVHPTEPIVGNLVSSSPSISFYAPAEVKRSGALAGEARPPRAYSDLNSTGLLFNAPSIRSGRRPTRF